MAYQKGDKKSIVIALGGNALGNTPREMEERVANTARQIVDLVESGNNVLVCHGNGPQVGMIANAFGVASETDSNIPEMPFSVCGAMSQGYIGYFLSQALLGELRSRNIMRSVACVVTQTVVDDADVAFENPTKPVGAFLSEEEAKEKMAETGSVFKEDAGRGWREVVASPKPARIVEMDAVCDLVESGYIVIAAGGGGVPVFDKEKRYSGVSAVIDKDLTSAKMAVDISADMLVILTAVEKVAINFNKANQENLDRVTKSEVLKLAEEGHFAPGSMLPKIQACAEYLDGHANGQALITSLDKALLGIEGKTGTLIVSD